MEKDSKVLEFFFRIELGAKSFVCESDLIKAVNEKDVERSVPIERIDLNTSGFVFTSKTFADVNGLYVIITHKNMFVFAKEYMKEFIQKNRNNVVKWNEYFLIKQEHLPKGNFFRILNKEDNGKS